MPSVLTASKLNLYDVKTKFHLQQRSPSDFFVRLLEEGPPLSAQEQQILDRTRQQYLYLAERPLLEVTVKMVVISPLLSLAGFYDPPFYTTLEEPVEIESQDGTETVRGQIDVLVLRNPLVPTPVWVAIVEAKSIQYDVMTA
ncbi:MAG: restriction endonuclease subunit R, partial [Pseudanabaenaceae cyanobacterium]